MDVTVKNVNSPPVPGPGPDQTVNEGVVTLDGGVSYDPDGDIFACQSSQTCGTAVNLADSNSCATSFTAPVLSGGYSDPEPDAVLQGSTALLRAERSGAGDGRVYCVLFTADDGDGGVCSGAVLMGALVAVLLELGRRRKASRPFRKA